MKSFHPLPVLLAATVLVLVLHASPARAQAAQPPAQPAQPAPPPSSEPVPSFVPVGEIYRFEVSVDAWSTLPSTMMYSDTESVTPAGSTTATTITGTNIDFKQQLGLHNQWFPAFHVVIRPQPKHKIRFDFYPLYYKESTTLATPLNFNGQSYLAGQTVASSLYWNEWQLGYEYDALTFDRGYIGAVVGANFYAVSGQLSNGSQDGTAGVHIPMPGLGAIGRYYATHRVSFTGAFTGYYLPGGDTSTHGHVIDVDLYATINVSKYIGIQGGYRLLDAAHHFDSPVNTGDFLINGGFIGGTFRY